MKNVQDMQSFRLRNVKQVAIYPLLYDFEAVCECRYRMPRKGMHPFLKEHVSFARKAYTFFGNSM